MPTFLLVTLALLLPHGGQYLPPLPDGDEPAAQGGVVTQPGSGPGVAFDPERWEWWFDFNHEELVRLRERMAARSGADFVALTQEDRQRLLPEFVHGLRSPRRDVRAAASMALGRLALPSALPHLFLMIEDHDLFVRTQAVLALGVSGQPGAVESLARILGDPDEPSERRTFAAAGLGLIGNREAASTLHRHLDLRRFARTRSQVRAALVYAAGLSGRVELLPALVAIQDSWLVSNDADLRALTGVALGMLGSPQGLPPLLTLLEADDNGVRRSAASGLRGLAFAVDGPGAEALAQRVASEGDLPTRFHLLRALGQTGQVGPFVASAFEGATTLVQPHAALGLGLDGSAAHVELLLSTLADKHERSLQAALVTALGLIGSAEAAPVLEAMLEEARDPGLRSALALAIGLLGQAGPDARAVLGQWAREEHDVEVVRWSLVALGLLGEREQILSLAQGLEEVRGTVDRAARLFGLGLVGDRTLIEPLTRWARDEEQPSYVTVFALQALGELGDPRAISPLSRLSRLTELSHEVGFLYELYQVK